MSKKQIKKSEEALAVTKPHTDKLLSLLQPFINDNALSKRAPIDKVVPLFAEYIKENADLSGSLKDKRKRESEALSLWNKYLAGEFPDIKAEVEILNRGKKIPELTPEELVGLINVVCTPKKNKLNGEYVLQRGAREISFSELCSEVNLLWGHAVGCALVRTHAEAIADRNVFNPAIDHFTQLPLWDGHDYVKDYFDCLQIKGEDYETVLLIFRRYLAAHVCMIMTEGVKVNRNVIVLRGGQRIGKDTWAYNLFRGLYGGVTTGTPAWTRHDTFKLASAALWLVSEIDKVKGSSKFKDIVSGLSGKESPLYKGKVEAFIRIASFLGTTNEDCLFDSDNTRFYIFYCDKLIKEPRSFDFTQLWAQAFDFFNTEKNSTWFTESEEVYQEKSNKLSLVYSPLEEHVRDMFEVSETEFILAKEIIAFIRAVHPQATDTAIGRALTKMNAATVTIRLGKGIHKCRGVKLTERGQQTAGNIKYRLDLTFDLTDQKAKPPGSVS
jgi:hypothetical protein